MSHEALGYSIAGLISCLKAFALKELSLVKMFCLMKPSFDVALPQMSLIWLEKSRLDLRVTPRYLTLSDFGIGVLWSRNVCEDGDRLCEKVMCSHFFTLNSMSHVLSQFSSFRRSNCRSAWFFEVLYRTVSSAKSLTCEERFLGRSFII